MMPLPGAGVPKSIFFETNAKLALSSPTSSSIFCLQDRRTPEKLSLQGPLVYRICTTPPAKLHQGLRRSVDAASVLGGSDVVDHSHLEMALAKPSGVVGLENWMTCASTPTTIVSR